MKINEEQFENLVIKWLQELGYLYENGYEIAPGTDRAERSDYRQVVLIKRLRSRFKALNPHVPALTIEDAINQITRPNFPSLLQSNRAFHRLLRDGVKVEFQADGETKADFVRIIDFENVENNEFLAVNQFSIKGTKHTKRLDIIIFINGLPIAVIELKNPADEKTTIVDAFRQLQTYKAEIPDLFNTNELLVIADLREARVGSLTADWERFMLWRTIDGETLDPLGKSNETETLIRGLLRRDFLLEFIRDFILFEEDKDIIKKIAAYHQFHLVRKAFKSTIEATKPEEEGKIGVAWHTQGSGKSISMAFYAGKVITAPEMKNPTIVVVTDRNDLDGQLFATFSNAKELLRETPKQAETRPKLRELLENRPSGGVIFTTIQKFSPFEDEDTFPVLSKRSNIVVIADEAHRTQYGLKARVDQKTGEMKYGYAYYLREALPNASFIAFTGTPISANDRDTRGVFGDYIDIYDMKQSQLDGATVPIYYESRLARLHLKEGEISRANDEAEQVTEDEEESVRERLKSRWAAIEKIVGSESRLKEIAADFVKHFEERQTAMREVGAGGGKAMFVCMSREICVRLYNEIITLRPEWHNLDPAKGEIKVIMTGSSSDKEILRPHIYSKQTKKDLEKRFKDEDDSFQIAIVRDMWLTGFDAPSLHTIYIDKPMRGHSLMQAIARVNRVFKKKPGGLVVDYIGIGHELKQALRDYTESGAQGDLFSDASKQAFPVLEKNIDIVRGMFHGFDYQDFETEAISLLPDAADHILGLGEDRKKNFLDAVVNLTKAFALCSTLEEAVKYREEIAFFQAVKAFISKPSASTKKISDEQRELALRQILSRAVVSDQVMDIFSTVGLDKPNIGILSEEFLEEVRLMPQKNLAVELLERLLKDEIKHLFRENVVQSKKFSDLLMQSLNKYHNRAIQTVEVIEELIQMAKEFNQASSRGEKLGLNDDEVAFYDALETNEASVRELGDETLKKIAIELTDNLRKNTTIDWAVRETVRARLRLMIKRILRKYKYPPDQEQKAVEIVLEQAETLSESWVS
jgi:type I restriction enzyme, R subunit